MPAPALYSAEEVAELLGLHVRTVRTYIRDGRLPATRIGKQYRIAPDDLATLTGGRTGNSRPTQPTAGAANPAAGIVIETSTVIDITNIDEPTMTRLADLLTSAAASRPDRDSMHVRTIYDPRSQTGKVIVVGGAGQTATLLELTTTLIQDQK